MNRFLVAFFLFALLIAGATAQRASAQTVAPLDLDPRLQGYPELTIRVTDEGIEAPAQVAAGRTLVVQENATAETTHFFIYRVPDEVSDPQLRAYLASEAVTDPEWFWRGSFVGNPDRAAGNGGRTAALVDLLVGRYLVMVPTDPTVEPIPFTAVAAPSDAPIPVDVTADVVAEMYEMVFRMPATVPAGRQLWEVTNVGAAPHELAIMPVPAGATAEQAVAALLAAFEAEEAGNPFDSRQLVADLGTAWANWTMELVHGVGVSSPSHQVFAQFELAPGTYVALCFFPDLVTFQPHLMSGMSSIFTVTEAPV